MPNKVKEFFSNSEPALKVELAFPSPEDYARYKEALYSAGLGEIFKAERLDEIGSNIEDPATFCEKKNEITVGAATGNGIKNVKMFCHQNSQQSVIETEGNKFLYMKFSVENSKPDILKITYRFQYELSHNVSSALEDIDEAIGIIGLLFNSIHDLLNNIDTVLIKNIVKLFAKRLIMFERLNAIEGKLDRSFDVSKIDNVYLEAECIDSIYYLLVKKYPVRISTESLFGKNRPERELFIPGDAEIGETVDCTYKGVDDYYLCGEDVRIFTTNLLSNAIIKRIVEDQEGSLEVIFRESEYNPMYISCRGYKIEDEANRSFQSMMEEAENYKSALTVREYALKDEAEETLKIMNRSMKTSEGW